MVRPGRRSKRAMAGRPSIVPLRPAQNMHPACATKPNAKSGARRRMSITRHMVRQAHHAASFVRKDRVRRSFSESRKHSRSCDAIEGSLYCMYIMHSKANDAIFIFSACQSIGLMINIKKFYSGSQFCQATFLVGLFLCIKLQNNILFRFFLLTIIDR